MIGYYAIKFIRRHHDKNDGGGFLYIILVSYFQNHVILSAAKNLLTESGLNIAYSYGLDGIRTEKTVNGKTTKYLFNGDMIIGEMRDSESVLYYYDAEGKAVGYGIKKNAETAYTNYYLLRNAQNDILEIYDSKSVKVGSYTYDTWGKPVAITPSQSYANAESILKANPFRYRGYYYDEETKLYYLNSRYYDPEVGRFINADGYVSTGQGILGNNMFSYCANNPVKRMDQGGEFWDTVFDTISLGASVFEVIANPTDIWAWAGLVGDAIDMIPFVTGVGETTRAVKVTVKAVDKVDDIVNVSKAVDFTSDVADLVKTLDRSSGFTKSTKGLGVKIHKGYKSGDGFNELWKEMSTYKGIRPDYVDFKTRTIYELKPNNPWSIKLGVAQLQKYNKVLGGGYNLRLEIY